MDNLNDKNKDTLKILLKNIFSCKQGSEIIKTKLKNNNNKLKIMEDRIIELLDELNIPSVKITDKATNVTREFSVNNSTKKKTLTKKRIKENCLLYCNGDQEQSEKIIDFLYDKEARGFKEYEKIVYDIKK